MAKSESLTLRFPPGTLDRARRVADHLATLDEYQGFEVSMSRVLVQGALRHLDQLEAAHGLSKKKRR